MTHLDIMERNIEAILFACGDPVDIARIAQALQTEERTAELLIRRIRDRYSDSNSSIQIIELNGSYQMCTRAEYADVIRSFMEFKRTAVLSAAALEVLSVVAYNQPVTRSFIDQVRGVDCSSIVRSLTEKKLIEEAGRMNIPGKPIAYRTTDNFLRCFNLSSLESLPKLPAEDPAHEDTQLEGQIDLF